MASLYPSDPARDASAVTASDTAALSNARGLYVGGAGDVSVEMVGGGTVVFSGVAAGSILPIQALRVRATGTTATNILALY